MKKVLLCLWIIVSFVSCKKDRPETSKELQKSNVILISIDTLRADALKLYDATQGVSTPSMEQVAGQGIVFRNVISQIPYTLPSHCTMLTGLYPIAHGVKDNIRDVLPENFPTLAEYFRANHFQTAGFAGSMVLNRRTGLARGFDYYDDHFSRADVKTEDLGGIERTAEEVLHSFEQWSSGRDRTRNFFAFLHFYDPHSPYTPPPGFRPPSTNIRELYHGEVRYVDSVIGRLVSYLKKENLWQSSVLIITSDHGEMLQEHEEIGHGFFLYQPALRVPLILYRNGLTPGQVEEPVQLVDLAPTVLQLIGLSVPSSIQGETLVPLLDGRTKKKNRLSFSESYFASLQLGISPIRSVQDGRYKYIDSPRAELYDLQKDPGEMVNQFGSQTSIANQMRRWLLQYQKTYGQDNSERSRRTVTSEEAEQFAALGYLGGSVPEKDWDRTKDPKDYIDEWNAMLQATDLLSRKEPRQALVLVQKIKGAAKVPSSLLLLEARCLLGAGRFPQAEALLKQIGGHPEAFTELAELYQKTGRFQEADLAYQKALEKEFSYFVLYNYVLFLKQAGRQQQALDYVLKIQKSRQQETEPFLAEIYFVLEQWQDAERLLSRLIQDRPWEAKWYVQLAGVYQAQGRMDQALQLLTAHLERFQQNGDYLLRLGILYHAVGQPELETQTFRKMIQNRPEDPRGYFYLAKGLLDQGGNLQDVIQLALQGFDRHPDSAMQIFGHYILGNAYQRTGKFREAQKQFAMAEKLEKTL